MAPLSLSKHALVGWCLLLSPWQADAFGVPFLGCRNANSKNHGASVHELSMNNNNYNNDNSNNSPWPQQQPTPFNASPEQVAAAEAALQAEFEAAVQQQQQSNNAFVPAVGTATPEQVAQAQAALDAELAAARGTQETSTSTNPFNNNDKPSFPPFNNGSNSNSNSNPPPWQKPKEQGKAQQQPELVQALSTSEEKTQEKPMSPFKPFPPSTSNNNDNKPFYGATETEAAENKAMAAIEAVMDNSNNSNKPSSFKPPSNTRPFPPKNTGPPFNNMASAATPALQNAAGTTTATTSPPFGNSPGNNNMPPSMGGGPRNNDNNDLAARMQQAGSRNNGNNDNESKTTSKQNDVVIDAANGNIPWFGQRAAASTSAFANNKQPSSSPPPSTFTPPKVDAAKPMATETTNKPNAGKSATPPFMATMKSSSTETANNNNAESSSASEQSEEPKAESNGFLFSNFMPTNRDSPTDAADTTTTTTPNGGQQQSSTTPGFGQPYAQSTTNSQYSFESNTGDDAVNSFDPAPPNSEPPRNSFASSSTSYDDQEQLLPENTDGNVGPLEYIWQNALNQKQRVALNKAAVRTVEYSLPVTAATAYLLSNNAEPLRNAEAAATYLANSAIPNAYSEWINEDKVRELTPEKNIMAQYMDRVSAPWSEQQQQQQQQQQAQPQVQAPQQQQQAQPQVQAQQQAPQEEEATQSVSAGEEAPTNYDDYLKWRAEQDGQQMATTQTEQQSSTVDPDAAAAAGVASVLNSEPAVEQQQQPPQATYADQMWNRFLSPPQSQPQAQQDLSSSQQQQAPSHADQMWNRFMNVPPAMPSGTPQPEQSVPQEETPSAADQMWNRAMTVPAAPEPAVEAPSTSESYADSLWERFHANSPNPSIEPEAGAQGSYDYGETMQQAQEPQGSNDYGETMQQAQEPQASEFYNPSTAESSWATDAQGQAPSFDSGAGQMEQPNYAESESSQMDQQKQQLATNLQAMAEEVNRRLDNPDTFYPEPAQEEINPVMWSNDDYYGYRNDASLF